MGVGHGSRKEVIQPRKFHFYTLTDKHRARRLSSCTCAGTSGSEGKLRLNLSPYTTIIRLLPSQRKDKKEKIIKLNKYVCEKFLSMHRSIDLLSTCSLSGK